MQLKIMLCLRTHNFRAIQGHGFVLRQATDVVMSEEARSLVMGIIGKVPGYVLERMQQDVHVVAGELIRSRRSLGNALNELALMSVEHNHHLARRLHA